MIDPVLHRTLYFRILLIVIVCFFVTGTTRAQKLNYMIINQPQSVTLLNKYEQRLSPSELNDFPEYLPAEVIDANVTLSDDYTQAIKVRYKDQILYVPVQSSQLSNFQMYDNVSQILDTVYVFESGKMALQSPDREKSDKLLIPRNTQVIRIFKYRSDHYVFIPGQVNRYGWMRFPNNKFWGKREDVPQRQDSTTDEIVFGKIVAKTEQVNLVFENLFEVLNDQTGSSQITPQWQIKQEDGSLQLDFVPDKYASDFSESNARFIQEIEYLLLGSKYRLQTSDILNRYIIYAP